MTRAEHRSLVRTIVPLLLSVAALLAAGGALAYVIVANSNRVEDIEQLIGGIQREREDNIRTACREQNDRHDSTILALDRVLADRLETVAPPERPRLRQGRASTVLLIEALVPRQDCEQRVRELVAARP